MHLVALTFLACHGQVQTGSCLFSLCSEPGDHKAALIWWPRAAWVSSCVSKRFLDQSSFVLPLAMNANTITVPSLAASVSHFSLPIQMWKGRSVLPSEPWLPILCHLKLVLPGSQPCLTAFWLLSSLLEKIGRASCRERV